MNNKSFSEYLKVYIAIGSMQIQFIMLSLLCVYIVFFITFIYLDVDVFFWQNTNFGDDVKYSVVVGDFMRLFRKMEEVFKVGVVGVFFEVLN